MPPVKMLNNQQINTYIADVLQDKMSDSAEPWEHQVAAEFRQAHANREMVEKRLEATRKQVTELETAVLKLTGQAEGFANLLIKQEMARQAPDRVELQEVIPIQKS